MFGKYNLLSPWRFEKIICKNSFKRLRHLVLHEDPRSILEMNYFWTYSAILLHELYPCSLFILLHDLQPSHHTKPIWPPVTLKHTFFSHMPGFLVLPAYILHLLLDFACAFLFAWIAFFTRLFRFSEDWLMYQYPAHLYEVFTVCQARAKQWDITTKSIVSDLMWGDIHQKQTNEKL